MGGGVMSKSTSLWAVLRLRADNWVGRTPAGPTLPWMKCSGGFSSPCPSGAPASSEVAPIHQQPAVLCSMLPFAKNIEDAMLINKASR